MKTTSLHITLIVFTVLAVSACAPSSLTNPAVVTTVPVAAATTVPTVAATAPPAAQSNAADRFAGTWSGTMSFTDDAARKEDIVVVIPTGCIAGNVCGDLNNTTVNCKWEMTLAAVNSDVFQYKFSKTMSGECPALGGGTLTVKSDGTLFREHKTPDFTASGSLKSQ